MNFEKLTNQEQKRAIYDKLKEIVDEWTLTEAEN